MPRGAAQTFFPRRLLLSAFSLGAFVVSGEKNDIHHPLRDDDVNGAEKMTMTRDSPPDIVITSPLRCSYVPTITTPENGTRAVAQVRLAFDVRVDAFPSSSSSCCVMAVVAGPASPTEVWHYCLLYTSPSPRDATLSRMPSSA